MTNPNYEVEPLLVKADSPWYPEVTVALGVVPQVGNLYTNITAMLSEMVANAWDADATELLIQVDPANDTIIIEDDGVGMSKTDINDKYLLVGYQKRYEGSTNTTPRGRHYMGRKGLGAYAVSGLGAHLEVQSIKDSEERVGFFADWEKVNRATTENIRSYRLTLMPPERISVVKGTRLTLTRLKDSIRELDVLELRENLATRFTVNVLEKIQIFLNDPDKKRPIGYQDRRYLDKIEYLWYFGKESKHYTKIFDQALKNRFVANEIEFEGQIVQVRGWVGTVTLPKYIKNNNRIALFAHGKLIQEDILAELEIKQSFRW